MINQKTIEERLSALEDRVTDLETIRSAGTALENQGSGMKGKKISVKEFVLEKKPKGDVQKTLVLAHYMEKYENVTAINVDDLAKCFRLAKEPIPGNLNDKINMNIRKGHMTEAEEKKENKKAWIVTNTGEQFIESGFKDSK
jgi:flagellar capping protein FliD